MKKVSIFFNKLDVKLDKLIAKLEKADDFDFTIKGLICILMLIAVILMIFLFKEMVFNLDSASIQEVSNVEVIKELPTPIYDLCIKKGLLIWLIIGFNISTFLAYWGFKNEKRFKN